MMVTHAKNFLSAVMLIAFLAPSNANADSTVYKCTDRTGHVEFSDVDKPGCKPLDLPGYLEQPGSDTTIRIPRGRDGHFQVQGRVNGVPVTFLVDTGASDVTVTSQVAADGNLPPGRAVLLETANGVQVYRRIRAVEVSVGSLSPVRTVVTAGLINADPRSALLGQNYLKYFDIRINANYMTITRR